MGYPFDIPARPAHGATPWDLEAQFGAVQQRIRQAECGVSLDSFEGVSDDDKLTAALSYAAAQTFKPPILLLQNRDYGPFTTPRDLYSGFKLLGGPAFSNQYRSALSTPQRILVNTSGAWLRVPAGQTFDVEISRLSFYSQSSTTDFLAGSTGVLWTSVIRDVGFSLFRHVLGSPTTKLLLTACLFDGWWNINNGRDAAVTVGGSDCTLWPQACLLDSPTSLSAGTPYHLWLSHMSKTTVGPMFTTCEQNPAAVRVSGSMNTGQLVFHGTRMEGRNQNSPSLGSVVRVDGGLVTFRDCWFAYGFSDWASLPASMKTGVRAGEGGAVSVLGGRVLFDACWYSRAGGSGVAETVPWIYASGVDTRVRVRNAQVSHLGGSFTGLPRVQAVNAATVDTDNSVTVI